MVLDFEDNKYHIELGYSSLFEWLTKAHGYDEGSANRRIQAARAMRAVPEVEQKLQDGKTTMTNLVKVQSLFRHSGKMSVEEKREVIERIEGQTTAEATKTLFKMFPEAALKINQDRRMIIDEEYVRYSYNLSQEQEEIMTRAKELLSHKIPNGSMAEIMTYLAAYFIERNDPLLEKPSVRRRPSNTASTCAVKTRSVNIPAANIPAASMRAADIAKAIAAKTITSQTSTVNNRESAAVLTQADVEANNGKVPENSIQLNAETGKSKSSASVPRGFGSSNFAQSNSARSNSATVSATAAASKRRVTVKERNEVIREADGRCEYVDHVTGKRCDSRVRMEADHIHMRVFGGSNNRENLRCLCRVHNQFMSEKNLGQAWAKRWKNRR
jgi:5-methylcytosine-specific restriction endonuclease McrA